MASGRRSQGVPEFKKDDLDRLEKERRTVSQVARDFVNNAIDPDLLSVPGIGKKSVDLLNEQGIETTDELIGQFFMVNRNEVKFVDFLEQVGIPNKQARECAEKFFVKFGRI